MTKFTEFFRNAPRPSIKQWHTETSTAPEKTAVFKIKI